MLGEVAVAEHRTPKRRIPWHRDSIWRYVQHLETGTDSSHQFVTFRRFGQLETAERTFQCDGDIWHDSIRTNGPTSVEVHPVAAVHLTPASVGINVARRDLTREQLNCRSSVIFEALARIDHGHRAHM